MKSIITLGEVVLVSLFIMNDVISAHPPIAVADGYAAGTTGGAGGEKVMVSSGSEFKSACESEGKKIIVVTKNLGNVGVISPKSNKTIIGAHTDAGYTGNLAMSGITNVIVQNLTIKNPSGIGTSDGVEASNECTKIFVTQCTFIDCKDGAFDIKRGSDFITVSWCRFLYQEISGHNFPNLIGHADNNGSQDRGKLHVTMHHNWYDKGCESRMPRVRFGYVHVYNNYYSCAKNSYCIGVGDESHIRVENCYFDNVKNAWGSIGGGEGGQIGWKDLKFVQTADPTKHKNNFPVFNVPYSFETDNVDDVKGIVMKGSGNVLSNVSINPKTMQRSLYTDSDTRYGNPIVRIFNYSGKMITSMRSSNLESTFNSSLLPPGEYLVKTQSPDSKIIERIKTVK